MKFAACSFAILLFTATLADACSCAPPPPPKKALEVAAAVFAGKVTKVEDIAPFQVKVTFQITRTWKGTKGKTETVTTSNNGASCGYRFLKGQSYLLYCYRPKKDQKRPSPLQTGICTRTKSMKDAKADLKELGEGKKP